MNFENLIYILSDFLDLLMNIYKLYILPFILGLWYYNVPLVVVSAETISNVTNETIDNSLCVAHGHPPKYPDDDSYCRIIYKFQNKTYAMAFHKSNPQPFPPYDLQVFTKKQRPGILSICINSKDYTDILLPYAGPKLNFYKDIENYSLKLSWAGIYTDTESQVTVTNTHGIVTSVDLN